MDTANAPEPLQQASLNDPANEAPEVVPPSDPESLQPWNLDLVQKFGTTPKEKIVYPEVNALEAQAVQRVYKRREIFGMQKKIFLAVLIVVAVLLAAIIGLGVGLGIKHSTEPLRYNPYSHLCSGIPLLSPSKASINLICEPIIP